LNHKNAVEREAAHFIYDEYLTKCQNKKDNGNMPNDNNNVIYRQREKEMQKKKEEDFLNIIPPVLVILVLTDFHSFSVNPVCP
jgi:hypothetical protein